MNKQEIKQIIQDSFDGLFNSGMIPEKINITDDTIIIGKGSLLDSISFITLFSDIEDRLSEETGQELFLVLGDIHEFNEDKHVLTIRILSDYIQTLIK